MTDKRYYIAYGSNLNVQQMRWRCPGARIIGTSELQDYRLLFKGSKTGSYLTVEPKKGCTVPVAVWDMTYLFVKSSVALNFTRTGTRSTGF